ncbi:MAG: hypothetical protein AB7O88_16040 [Reyranellaceae bacterium]
MIVLLVPAVAAAEPLWIAERVDPAAWRSAAIWPPTAIARATRTPAGTTVQVTCAVETNRRVLRLRHADLDRIAQRGWQPALVARIDGAERIDLEYVDRAEWQSQPLSSNIQARLRTGSFLVIEQVDGALRLQLPGMRDALDRLEKMCVAK